MRIEANALVAHAQCPIITWAHTQSTRSMDVQQQTLAQSCDNVRGRCHSFEPAFLLCRDTDRSVLASVPIDLQIKPQASFAERPWHIRTPVSHSAEQYGHRWNVWCAHLWTARTVAPFRLGIPFGVKWVNILPMLVCLCFYFIFYCGQLSSIMSRGILITYSLTSSRRETFCFFETWRPEWDSNSQSPTFQAGSINHFTRAPP